MRIMLKAAFLSVALALAACTYNATTSQAMPELNAAAHAAFVDLTAGRDDAIVARMSSATDPAQVRAQLPVLRRLIGDAPPPAPQVVGTRNSITNQGRFYEVSQRYEYPDRVATAATVFKSEEGVWKVHGFNVNVVMRGEAAPAPEVAPVPQAPGGVRT